MPLLNWTCRGEEAGECGIIHHIRDRAEDCCAHHIRELLTSGPSPRDQKRDRKVVALDDATRAWEAENK